MTDRHRSRTTGAVPGVVAAAALALALASPSSAARAQAPAPGTVGPVGAGLRPEVLALQERSGHTHVRTGIGLLSSGLGLTAIGTGLLFFGYVDWGALIGGGLPRRRGRTAGPVGCPDVGHRRRPPEPGPGWKPARAPATLVPGRDDHLPLRPRGRQRGRDPARRVGGTVATRRWQSPHLGGNPAPPRGRGRVGGRADVGRAPSFDLAAGLAGRARGLRAPRRPPGSLQRPLDVPPPRTLAALGLHDELPRPHVLRRRRRVAGVATAAATGSLIRARSAMVQPHAQPDQAAASRWERLGVMALSGREPAPTRTAGSDGP